MAISEEKLLEWSVQESTDLSSNAYNFIKSHLFKLPFVIQHHNYFQAFLQGSYANATNIKRDSDVDIVLQYSEVFRYDDSSLSEISKREMSGYYSKASLTFKAYKDTIYKQLKETLKNHTRVQEIQYKAKSLKIILKNPSIEVDVVPCFLYKKYVSFSLKNPDSPSHYIEGISFDNTDNDSRIVNFPKEHIKNGEEKNRKERTNGNFKMTVRYIKKIKSLLVDRGYIKEKQFGSYFIENLLYNVPDTCFKNSCLETFSNIVHVLLTADISKFICQHGQWRLFGQASTQWNIDSAKEFIALLDKVNKGNINL